LTFGSVLPLAFVVVVAADVVVVVADVVVVAVGAADAENTPPNASETTTAIAITPALASRRDVLNIVGLLPLDCEKPPRQPLRPWRRRRIPGGHPRVA
jgi:hypothetical protein